MIVKIIVFWNCFGGCVGVHYVEVHKKWWYYKNRKTWYVTSWNPPSILISQKKNVLEHNQSNGGNRSDIGTFRNLSWVLKLWHLLPYTLWNAAKTKLLTKDEMKQYMDFVEEIGIEDENVQRILDTGKIETCICDFSFCIFIMSFLNYWGVGKMALGESAHKHENLSLDPAPM